VRLILLFAKMGRTLDQLEEALWIREQEKSSHPRSSDACPDPAAFKRRAQEIKDMMVPPTDEQGWSQRPLPLRQRQKVQEVLSQMIDFNLIQCAVKHSWGATVQRTRTQWRQCSRCHRLEWRFNNGDWQISHPTMPKVKEEPVVAEPASG